MGQGGALPPLRGAAGGWVRGGRQGGSGGGGGIQVWADLQVSCARVGFEGNIFRHRTPAVLLLSTFNSSLAVAARDVLDERPVTDAEIRILGSDGMDEEREVFVAKQSPRLVQLLGFFSYFHNYIVKLWLA